MDTIDEITQELRVVGYGYLNVFCQQGKTEAEGASDAFVLNEGGHQVPIYYGKVNPNKGSWDNTSKAVSKIPCTSVLVRIVHAPRNRDTNKILSVFDKDVTAEQHEEMGLYVRSTIWLSDLRFFCLYPEQE